MAGTSEKSQEMTEINILIWKERREHKKRGLRKKQRQRRAAVVVAVAGSESPRSFGDDSKGGDLRRGGRGLGAWEGASSLGTAQTALFA
ncbi:hypothetical protein Taro_041155 [Colocasia esculenta]|uniref:Uncharacterized protein n=1 Tax=Colocasia esculenta TaxID=4460 RepID=A0A843WF23_COLES|nr:hypothetical protein [Colocasia esculenta]